MKVRRAVLGLKVAVQSRFFAKACWVLKISSLAWVLFKVFQQSLIFAARSSKVLRFSPSMEKILAANKTKITVLFSVFAISKAEFLRDFFASLPCSSGLRDFLDFFTQRNSRDHQQPCLDVLSSSAVRPGNSAQLVKQDLRRFPRQFGSLRRKVIIIASLSPGRVSSYLETRWKRLLEFFCLFLVLYNKYI